MQDLVGVLVGPCGRVMEKGAVCVNRWNRWESGIGRRQVMWERTTGTGGTRSKREAGQAGTHRTKGAGRGEGGMVSRALMCAARTREGGAGGRSARAQHWGGKSERAPVSWSLPVGLAWGWPWIAPSPSFVAQAGAHTRPLRQGKGDTAAAAENERSGRSDRWRPEGISTTPTDSLSPATDTTHCLRVRLKRRPVSGRLSRAARCRERLCWTTVVPKATATCPKSPARPHTTPPPQKVASADAHAPPESTGVAGR